MIMELDQSYVLRLIIKYKFMGETIGRGEDSSSRVKLKATRTEINVVSNGFIIGVYGVDQKIANTLDEALALVRKELE